ncbi:MAG: zf-HC2 domain-containing protein [Acidobacteriota bacterium]
MSTDPDLHPSLEELVAYRRGRLTEERTAEVQAHLAECRGDCPESVLDLADLEAPDEERPLAQWEEQKLAAWQALDRRLSFGEDEVAGRGERTREAAFEASSDEALEEIVSPPPIDGGEESPEGDVIDFLTRGELRKNPWFFAAAALLVATLALVFFLTQSRQEAARWERQARAASSSSPSTAGTPAEIRAELQAELRAETERRTHELGEQLESAQDQVAELSRRLDQLTSDVGTPPTPQLFVPGADLFPDSFVRGSGQRNELEIPAAMDRFTVTLNLSDAGAHDAYRLLIRQPDGDLLWLGNGLLLSDLGNFSVLLSRRAFPAADYRFDLEGQESNGAWTLLESYQLTLRDLP